MKDQRDDTVGKDAGCKPNDLNSIPGIHTVEGEKQLPHVVL